MQHCVEQSLLEDPSHLQCAFRALTLPVLAFLVYPQQPSFALLCPLAGLEEQTAAMPLP